MIEMNLEGIFSQINESSENCLTQSNVKSVLKVLDILEYDVQNYQVSRKVARSMYQFSKFLGFDEIYARDMFLLGFIHDIGNIKIPQGILKKEGTLTEEEYALIEKHTYYGLSLMQENNTYISKQVVEGILYHHENYDGSGYPTKLKGDEIPQSARILRIVDSYEAMRLEKPNGCKLTKEEAISELLKYVTLRYDQDYTEKFISYKKMKR